MMPEFEWSPESEDGSKWLYVKLQHSVAFGMTYTFHGSVESIPGNEYEAMSCKNNVCRIFPTMKQAADYVYWEARV